MDYNEAKKIIDKIIIPKELGRIPSANIMILPIEQKRRLLFYKGYFEEIKKYTAVFAVSDYYAMDFIVFLKSKKMAVPEDMPVVGFDDVRECGRRIY